MSRKSTTVLVIVAFLAGGVLEAFVGWLWLFAEPLAVLIVSINNTVGALFVEPLGYPLILGLIAGEIAIAAVIIITMETTMTERYL